MYHCVSSHEESCIIHVHDCNLYNRKYYLSVKLSTPLVSITENDVKYWERSSDGTNFMSLVSFSSHKRDIFEKSIAID